MTLRTPLAVSLEPRGGALVARLTVDNARKLNSLTRESLQQFVELMNSLTNPRLGAVVLTGAGDKAFIGGADLETLGALDPASAREFIGLIHDACAAIRDCALPVLARINGWCLGAGLELAAACDLRIAADTAAFGMPEVRLGIPSVVEAALLPRLVGAGRARWLVMTGETIGASEALSWGLVEKVFEEKELDKGVNQTLDAILSGGAEAMRAQKRLCRLWEEAPLEASVRASIDEFARSYESGEPRRRVEAFRKKRKKQPGAG
ncbi:MAG: enoyl-CoA hydratase/isomerase family protein [Betaproteobacteria bacterium]|nr:enoyl-CoA hydratase/isomerase family protein [Betaproteobacteria bacterium]